MRHHPMFGCHGNFNPHLWSDENSENEIYMSPRADIIECSDEYLILAELPGVDKNNFKVEFEKNTLTITGKKNKYERKEGEQFLRVERQCGDYQRSFRIGNEINTEQISAKYANGILEIHLPKTQVSQSKSVEIQIN
ncbi:MAG: Hsp20 family protein [bacterium]|nr:Hsp20 family protein [bacterium]